VFLYLNSATGMAFAPAYDENVGNLSRCFRSGNQLTVTYSMTPAWG